MTYLARLIDQEGKVWKEWAISEKLRVIEVAIPPKIRYVPMEEIPVLMPAIQTVIFQYERTAGDGVLIYRRITPLWGAK